MIPDSFIRESDLKRIEEACELERRAINLLARDAASYSVFFRFDDGRPEAFAHAARVAVALDREKSGHCTMDNLEAVSFQPVYGDGKWRIFNRGGPFAGKEWDLSAETLWKAWDATE